MRRFTLRRRAATLVALGALVSQGAIAAVTMAPSQAATGDQSISGVAASMWQTNSPVETLAAANGVVYAGGSFTKVRPPGTATGAATEVARTYLAAFNASTGALITSFNYTLNGRVNDLALSPDNSTLYLAGAFSTVNGTARGRVAAINLSTNTLNAWNPNANKAVTAVAATSSRVYLSGDFTTVKSAAKAVIASVYAPTATDGTSGNVDTAFSASLVAPPPSTNPFTGVTTTYNPHALAMTLTPDGSRLLVGGGFDTVNGVQTGGMASLDPATGASQTWAANAPGQQPINLGCVGRVRAIVTDSTGVYVTGEGDPPGCYEGTYKADFSGNLVWNEVCLGASQGIAVLNGVLYKGSHQHDCAFMAGDARGGFVGGTSRSSFLHHYLTAQNATTGGFVHWTPQTNAAGTGGVGPHVMATDGSQIFVGGDFTKVGTASQQGLARFSNTGNQATPKTPGVSYLADPFSGATATTAANLAVTVTPTAAGTLTVEVPTVEDADNGTLTYSIFRDNGTTAINTQSAESYPWSRPVIRFDDKGLAAGSAHTYRVSASDGAHASAKSTAVSGTVASAAPPAFTAATTALNPLLWWRLDDTGTTTVADSSLGGLQPGQTQGGVTQGQTGALTGDSAVTLDGTSGYVTSSNQIAAPNAFSESAWFKTTSISGGTILAQSDTQTGAGGNTDRIITMDNNGGLVFAVKGAATGSTFGPSTINFRNQGPIWNDGKWHQVVGTYDGNGVLSLYVDGALQGSVTGSLDNSALRAAGMATSYLRTGYADLSQIQVVFGRNFYNRKWPASEFFGGSVDESTVFGSALTAAQVRSLYAAGVGGGA